MLLAQNKWSQREPWPDQGSSPGPSGSPVQSTQLSSAEARSWIVPPLFSTAEPKSSPRLLPRAASFPLSSRALCVAEDADGEMLDVCRPLRGQLEKLHIIPLDAVNTNCRRGSKREEGHSGQEQGRWWEQAFRREAELGLPGKSET